VPAVGELFAVRELVRLPARKSALSGAPKGDGRTIVLFPGYSTADRFLYPLARFLRSRGHEVAGWGLGRNDGDVFGKIDRVRAHVSSLAEETGRPVSLLGWSLGGVFAREVARDAPEHVHHVVTLGTPLHGPPETVSYRIYTPETVDEIKTAIKERALQAIDVPMTAFFSKSDRIVPWQNCIDEHSPLVENVEVSSTHIGMTIDPDIWQVVANRLSVAKPGPRPEGLIIRRH